MLKAVLFDLDGTLLPMEQSVFAAAYFQKLAAHTCPLGYTPETFMTGMKRGIAAMVQNDGSRSGETAFWEAMSAVCGKSILTHQEHVAAFYDETFDTIRKVCGYNPMAAEVVHALREKGVRVILATNPLFPRIATHKRIRWAGLEPEDFELCTTYEDFGYCKPNPDYYREILRRADLSPEDCLMVSNDMAEDMMAGEAAGLSVFLLTDCLINKPNADVSRYPHGSFDQLTAYLNRALSKK